MSINLGVNGFGRIGRMVVRAAIDQGLNVVGVNDIADPERMAHLFKYDSVHGTYPEDVEYDGENLNIGSQSIRVSQEEHPSELPWDQLDVDVAIESTGLFRARDDAAGHLEAGAEKVIISAPAGESDLTVVVGVNDSEYDPAQHDIISNASCTTNCLAPVAKALNDTFGIESGVMTTTHGYTNSQNLLDSPRGKDFRRMRAAAVSMIPTTTGAATATTVVLPELEGKLDGMAIRVPVPNVSVVDFAVVLEEDVTVEDIDGTIKEYATGDMNGVLDHTEIPLVSTDYVGNPHSSVYDSDKTIVMNGNHAKLLCWYDNEWGYSNRIVDLSQIIVGVREPVS